MKIFTKSFALILCSVFAFGFSVFAQSQTFEDPKTEYKFQLPEATWKQVVKPTESNPNVEYVYGDRSDGHLEIRKVSMNANELMSDVIRREQEQKLQFLPGYVGGKEEAFAGNLRGTAFNFEYIRAGRNMSGRFYFLKTSPTDVYVLRFTGQRDKLRGIRNQTDSIARTFQLKK